MTESDRTSVNGLRGWLLRAEAAVDRVVARRRDRRGRASDAVLVPHAGYEHPNGIECYGRVQERGSAWVPKASDGRLANLRGVGSLFATYEIAGADVGIEGPGGEERVLTDAEGYLRATLPAPERAAHTAWTSLPTDMNAPDGDAASLPILRVGASARFAIVSDVDDTVMETGAENLARNLWTTFTGNALTRRVYSRVPPLYRALHRQEDGTANPLFYLSSSPWNLYGLIHDVFDRTGVPWGPIFLRDYGIDENKFITSTHGEHKLGNARRLMAQLDGLPFILIGDLGQADAEIYATLVREHPTQVAGVIMHRPSGREHADKLRHIEEIDAAGVPVVVTRDYADAETLARERGWIG